MSDDSSPEDPSPSQDIPESATTNNAYLDSLAKELSLLQHENISMGAQNEELARQLHEMSAYNQALGLDLYQLDEEISTLEGQLSEKRSELKEIERQTREINRQANEC
jgi:predicted RNase H-like nuclease (RuvC/YqgF family)